MSNDQHAGYRHTYDAGADAFGECTTDQHAEICKRLEESAVKLFPGLSIESGIETITRGISPDVCDEITERLNREAMRIIESI